MSENSLNSAMQARADDTARAVEPASHHRRRLKPRLGAAAPPPNPPALTSPPRWASAAPGGAGSPRRRTWWRSPEKRFQPPAMRHQQHIAGNAKERREREIQRLADRFHLIPEQIAALLNLLIFNNVEDSGHPRRIRPPILASRLQEWPLSRHRVRRCKRTPRLLRRGSERRRVW